MRGSLGLIPVLVVTLACGREEPHSTTPPAPAAATVEAAEVHTPAGWAGRVADASRLRLTDKFPEAIALFEPVVREHPDFWPAHFQLGRSYLDRANRDASLDAEARGRHYETAIGHYRRALAAGGDADPRVFIELLAIYDRTALNRPAEGEPIARAMLARHPSRHEPYDWLTRLLSTLGRHHDAAEIFARASQTLEGGELRASAETMETHVRLFEDMAPEDARAIRASAEQARRKAGEPSR